MLQSGIEKRRQLGARDYRLDRFEASGDAVAVAFTWTAEDGSRAEWAQALIVRDGRIVHIQDFASPANAFNAARR